MKRTTGQSYLNTTLISETKKSKIYRTIERLDLATHKKGHQLQNIEHGIKREEPRKTVKMKELDI
jgi:hypothetical protein